ncbi:MAG TPA: YabP/YqfC family sporulation protein [Candidatus Faecenecus gallistercoris]|jgi:hypothetical protein|uniref:YabP/YqfC family sporulation protein n=1 Tax=Candidatus Faecenecus gallistercoris TaxID=2840793 RepID=A0A9D0YZV7_9FIRM|nr:YabP/YqfC family sporulation protein [Bacillota bacterium]MDD7102700.1 YabP/YqfC family sporulation protein [Bacillota bacterium]MDY4051295.1 YabP/YqfC family sporulation protein [Candidatus Faecenecus gallistercoris]CDE08132.1 unknown [Bacillus sp. CAG:988]HIQ64973.1 YabP/YqfC family sporulation protein [Candidatus Faecenecus gallistercoris]
MFQKLERRIFDRQYRLFLTEDFLNITNISKVLILEPTIILVAIGSIQIEIRGENLVLKQMMDDEILITGTVLQIVKKVYE